MSAMAIDEHGAPAAPRRADLRFAFAHPAHLIALGLGSGLSRQAPGTAGTLFAWLAFVLLDRWLDEQGWAIVLVASWPLGWWACLHAARELRQHDPSAIVWDEVWAFWLVLWLVMPTDWLGQLAAFVIFRLFDAVKPGPVAWADALFKPPLGAPVDARGAFGILFDDLVAALCTLVIIALWRT